MFLVLVSVPHTQRLMVNQQKGWKTPWNTMRNCRLLHRVIMERKHYLSKQDIGDMHGHGHALPFSLYGRWGAAWWETEAEQNSKEDSAAATWKQPSVMTGMEKSRVFRLHSVPYPACGFCGEFQKKGWHLERWEIFSHGQWNPENNSCHLKQIQRSRMAQRETRSSSTQDCDQKQETHT